MKVATDHVYLCFDIQTAGIQKVGSVQILLNKLRDIEKWKNPHSCEEEVVSIFKEQHSQFKYTNLRAFYTSDLAMDKSPKK